MDTPLSQLVRARLITMQGKPVPTLATLSHDGTDPLKVHIDLPLDAVPGGQNVTRSLARDLLARGLHSSAATRDIDIWPCCRSGTVLEFRTPGAVVLIQFDTIDLQDFLLRTYAATGRGREALVRSEARDTSPGSTSRECPDRARGRTTRLIHQRPRGLLQGWRPRSWPSVTGGLSRHGEGDPLPGAASACPSPEAIGGQ